MNKKAKSCGVLVAMAALCGTSLLVGCGDDSSTSVNDENLSSSVETPASSADAKSSSSSKDDKTVKSSSSVKKDKSSSSVKKDNSSSSVKGDNKSSSSKALTLEDKLGKCEDKGQYVVLHVQDDEGNWYSCYRGEWTEGMLEVEGPDWGKNPENQSSSSATREGDVLVDSRDGESYKTVYIGKQHWMAENLRYRADESDTLKAGRYGRRYTWAEAIDSSICPNGWHIPSSEEWKTFIDELEKLSTKPFEIIADGDDWQTSAGNNSTGFTAVPAGMYSGGTVYRSNQAFIWSSSTLDEEKYPDAAPCLRISEKGVRIEGLEKFYKISIRCIED